MPTNAPITSLSTAVQRPTLFALHGNGGGAFRYRRTELYVPSELHFIAMTLPGFAGMPELKTEVSLKSYAYYVLERMLEVPPPRLLLGQGISAAIVMELLRHHPEAIQGIILHEPADGKPDAHPLARILRNPTTRRAGRWLLGQKWAQPLIARRLFHESVPPQTIDRFFHEYASCPVYDRWYEWITPAWFASLVPVTIPAAVLWGGRGGELHIEPARDYRRLLPGAFIRVVPEWGRFPMLEQPAAFMHEVTRVCNVLLARTRAQDSTYWQADEG